LNSLWQTEKRIHRMTLKWLLNRSQLPPDGRVLLRRTASYERLQHNRHVDVPGTALKVKFLSLNSQRLLGLRKNANKAPHRVDVFISYVHMLGIKKSQPLCRFRFVQPNLILHIVRKRKFHVCKRQVWTATSRLHSPQAIVKVWGRLVIESRHAHQTAFRMMCNMMCYYPHYTRVNFGPAAVWKQHNTLWTQMMQQ